MRNQRATALILDVFDLQERDRIVTFLTAEHGKRRGVARGARTKYSRFAGQLQPLAKVDIAWFERDNRDLARIGEVSLDRSAAALSGDLERILLAAYLADHMIAFAQEDEHDPALFRLLDSTLDALIGGVDPMLAARYYEIWMLRLAGIFPSPRACPTCGETFTDGAVLVEHDSALVCTACAPAGGQPISVTAHAALVASARLSLARMAEMPLPPAVVAEIEMLCGRIRRAFLGRELKSYEVMKRTLASV